MKRCPQCDQTYNDGSLNFCLLDGTQLVGTDSEPTVVIPRSAAPRKSRMLLWAGIVVFILLVGSGGLAAFLIYYYSGQDESGRWDQRGGVNALPSPKPTATPRATMSPIVSSTPIGEPSPAAEESKPTPPDTEAEEITPIAWNTSAIQFKGEVGKVYRFECPENGTSAAIWGNDIYTKDSSICTAAVHAGILTLDRGGVVTVEFRPGRLTYGSTVRNGITSNTYGEYASSFVVR